MRKINGQAKVIIGVDLGGTKSLFGLADETGEILKEAEYPTGSQERVFAHLVSNLRRFMADHGIEPNRVSRIGLGVAGVVDHRNGTVSQAPNLGWDRFPLKVALEDRFHVPVALENDVNAATLGEHWRGAARGLRHYLFVAVGTGIGAGIMINRELYRGHSYSAGEIGYDVLRPDALREADVAAEYLESLASGTGLLLWANRRRGGRSQFGSTAEVMAAAEAGDEAALIVVREATELLGLSISNAVNLLDPELVVLGGGLCFGAPSFVERIQAITRKVLPKPIPVVLSTLGGKAQLYGAVKLCLDQMRTISICREEA
ncbi:MAG: ROK family protein [Bacteroidota bacterium]